jgi:SAM-dependent methyltransferase
VNNPITLQEQLEKMRRDWDERARQNARHYVDNSKTDWSDEEFFGAGEQSVREQILNDTANIYQGRDPASMKVIEIGCGAGRLTQALSKVFGEVYAVDVSGEMVAQARRNLSHRANAHVYQNSGCDLAVLPRQQYDFAYSLVVFQHIPSYQVIENYVREVHRLLRPGALFKFQVQGYPETKSSPDDTWNGVPFTRELAAAMAERCGFEMRYAHGDGDQYFWLWYFKRPWLDGWMHKLVYQARRIRRGLIRRARALFRRG